LVYQTVVVATTRDTSSGHTASKTTPLGSYDASELDEGDLAAFNLAVARARSVPGKRFLAGRPTIVGVAPAPVASGRGAQAQAPPDIVSPEVQVQMDAHYWRLSPAGQAEFRGEYPMYMPGPAPSSTDHPLDERSGVASGADSTIKAGPTGDAQARNAKAGQAKVGK
jgi:hypothetical protein